MDQLSRQTLKKIDRKLDKVDETLEAFSDRLARLEEASGIEIGLAENSTFELTNLQTQVKIQQGIVVELKTDFNVNFINSVLNRYLNNC